MVNRTRQGRLVLSKTQWKEYFSLREDARAYYFRRLRLNGISHDQIMREIDGIERNMRENYLW
jgi:hypothetical protein